MASIKSREIGPNAPSFDKPLVSEPKQSEQVKLNLGNLAPLIGTWVNEAGIFGYNLMPLPQTNDSNGKPWEPGYILKNTPYFEELTFSAINGNAPNRGGLGTQVANTIFYEQRVYFHGGPDKDSLVHAENGSWLYFNGKQQLFGPYGDTYIPNSVPPITKYEIAKQMSVPHGNSILAVGNSKKNVGQPDVPVSPEVIPPNINGKQYTEQSVGNPIVALTLDPNKVLEEPKGGVTGPNNQFITLEVDSENVAAPTNIGFEESHAKVTGYKQTLWLLSSEPEEFNRLKYTQTISLELTIDGKKVNFPHVTANTLVRKTF